MKKIAGLLLVSGLVSLLLLLCIIANGEKEGFTGRACGYIGIVGYFALAATDSLRKHILFNRIDDVVLFMGNWAFYFVILWAVSKMVKLRRRTS